MSRVLLLAFVAALLLFPTAAGAGASGVVVSQIYGGGGNAGATFRNDYVELFNGGSGSAAGLSNTSAALRANDGCTDSGDNATDFTAAPPTPRNSASPQSLCTGASPGPSGSVSVDLSVASVLSVSLDRPALSFGTFTS